MKDVKCRMINCENIATQLLVRKTTLLRDMHNHEQGDVWNSSGGYLCDDCSSDLFHTKNDPLLHGFNKSNDSKE